MTVQYFVRRNFADIFPYLDAIRAQADSEREALGFLPEPAYAECARQRKLILLLSTNDGKTTYAGHLLFGGIFPNLRVRQICVAPNLRHQGHATRLLRTLISQGEQEGYLNVVANVASDLIDANSFYEKNGFLTSRLKAGGAARNRSINVRILQLETPSLISLMVGSNLPKAIDFIQPRKRSDVPIYAIDLNVFFDAIRARARSEDAGAVIESALHHQIRVAASQEFIEELKRTSHDKNDDPVLSFARRIPSLPAQDKATLEKLTPLIASAIFPERSARNQLQPNDKSDVLHLAHAIAAGASGYITSDAKILSARDVLMANFGFDVIGLSEFVALLELPSAGLVAPAKKTKHFRIQAPATDEVPSLLNIEHARTDTFLAGIELSQCQRSSVSDDEGIVGISLLAPASAIDQPSRAVVCVRQDHPFTSTIADFLISEIVHRCSKNGPGNILALDIPSHPITRRVALSQGFQKRTEDSSSLAKVALGRPITNNTWEKTRLAVERLSGLKLQKDCPHYGSEKVKIVLPKGERAEIGLFELETLLSPTLFAFPRRNAVVVPITRTFAADLLGTDLQYSFLDVPEAQFLSRRTYLNTTRAAHAMIRGAAIAFYESVKSGGRGAVVAVGRIIDVTSIPTGNIPEILQRGAVVEDPSALTGSDRVLATTFDNLVPMRNPVTLKKLREIGCVTGANFVSATPISAAHLKAIVDVGCTDE
jgi:predicted nucleic acid-binding protein/GNAT superfamily N-acetyltransferase